MSQVAAPPDRSRLNPTLLRFARAKGTAVGLRLVNEWARLKHRVTAGPTVRHLDHVTIPCSDLAVAEAFYVGVLGARVLVRADEAFLKRLGREGKEAAGAIHTSVVFHRGARIDLFLQNTGQPPPSASHPHYAFAISPRDMLLWKERLAKNDVPTFGPTRLGPPGQASLYFNDPFGNHLELATTGFAQDIPVGPPVMSKLVYEWRGGPSN